MTLITSDYNKTSYCKSEFTIEAIKPHEENYSKYSCDMDEFLLDFSIHNHNCNHKDCYYKIEKPCTFNINGTKNISDFMGDEDYYFLKELKPYNDREDMESAHRDYTIKFREYTFRVNKKILIFSGVLLGIALNIKYIIN